MISSTEIQFVNYTIRAFYVLIMPVRCEQEVVERGMSCLLMQGGTQKECEIEDKERDQGTSFNIKKKRNVSQHRGVGERKLLGTFNVA